MAGMVERVAKAIWDDACPGMTWGDIDKLTYMGWAQAAIDAMRVPTIEMEQAAAYYLGSGLDINPTWRAMLDAALARCSSQVEQPQ